MTLPHRALSLVALAGSAFLSWSPLGSGAGVRPLLPALEPEPPAAELDLPRAAAATVMAVLTAAGSTVELDLPGGAPPYVALLAVLLAAALMLLGASAMLGLGARELYRARTRRFS